jgi:hypothetical protein
LTAPATDAYLILFKNQLGDKSPGRENQMRLIKMLGLAVTAAVAAMAFVGATSANAANTQLCNLHGALTCGSAATSVSMAGWVELLGSLNIRCDNVGGSGTPLALANPQSVHISDLLFNSCKTSGNDKCVVIVQEQPLANLNKTGLDVGTLTGTTGKIYVECEDVLGDIDVECEYDATGLEFPVGGQHLTGDGTPVDEIGSDFLCPNSPTIDALLTTTANRYVLA